MTANIARVSATVGDPGSHAASSYHSLLAGNPALAHETAGALRAAHQERRIMMQGRLLCTVLRPRFLDAATSTALAQAASCIAGILERAGQGMLGSDRLLDAAGASEAEREIWSIEPGFDGLTLTSRLDAFIGSAGIRFIEYNAESPAGIGYCDCLTEVFEDLPAMRTWSEGHRFQPHHARHRLWEVLLHAYRQWSGGPQSPPRIAIIDWEDVPTKRDFELCAEYFREQGAWVEVTDPRRLEYRKGRVWLGEEPIDLVYRRVLLHELLDKAGEAGPLLDAYRDGAICMVNSPRSKLLHKKSVFALLSAGELGIALSDDERRLVEATVPWTRRLTRGTTEFHGCQVDLRQLLIEQLERFAVKPVDDYGGKGVVLGWETEAEAWRRFIDGAPEGAYIVQERVEVPREKFPVIKGDSIELEPLWVDTDPLLFRGDMGCILTRMSGTALLNVTAGSGSTTPTFVLEEGD